MQREAERICKVLQEAWAKAEPGHAITLYPESYVRTFYEMACAVVAASAAPAAPTGQPIEIVVLEAAKQAFGYDGGLQTINETDLRLLAQYLRLASSPVAPSPKPSERMINAYRAMWQEQVALNQRLCTALAASGQAEAPVAPQAEARQPLIDALREIADMTFDPWTNGARAGEIARAALESAPTAPQAGTEENPNTYCVPTGKRP